jgi:DNA-binding NarL/FixJ family response regulator
MQGLPPKTILLRVAVQADHALVDALSAQTESLILSPVETSLEISARVTQADVILVDVTQNPAAALESIRSLQLDRPILALVSPGHAAEALAAGAAGAILRTSAPLTIAAALSAIHESVAVVDTAFIEQLMAAKPANVGVTVMTDVADDTLTKREHEVLALMADGLSNKQIAARLEISEHTAKFHVNSILQKMNAQKRVEAVVRAAKMGIIHL